jgi:hypothetical protein
MLLGPSRHSAREWYFERSAIMSIVTLTMNPAIDKSAVVDRVVPERKLRCREPNFEPGGGGINVGRVLQRLGEKVNQKLKFTVSCPVCGNTTPSFDILNGGCRDVERLLLET